LNQISPRLRRRSIAISSAHRNQENQIDDIRSDIAEESPRFSPLKLGVASSFKKPSFHSQNNLRRASIVEKK